MGEKKIIVAGLIILAFGTGKSFVEQKPLDKVVIGGLVFMLLLAVLAAFGTAEAALAGDLAMLSLLGVLIADGLPLLQKVSSLT